jgi:hypothetical protein
MSPHSGPAGTICVLRTNSGRIFRGDAPQQCASHRGETREAMKTSVFAMALPVA